VVVLTAFDTQTHTHAQTHRTDCCIWTSFIDVVVLINSAVNFVLYCTMSRQFRQTFGQLFLGWPATGGKPKTISTSLPSAQRV